MSSSICSIANLIRHKTQFKHYGVIWIVLGYIALLIILDRCGFFVVKTKIIRHYVNKVCELKATVVSEPDERSNRIEFIAETLLSEITPARKVKLLAKCYDIESNISLYDVIEVRGKILQLPKPRNPGQFDYGAYLLRKGVCGVLIINDYTVEPVRSPQHFLFFLREIFKKIHICMNKFVFAVRHKMITTIKDNLPAEESSILIAMFAGEKTELPAEIRSWFVDS
ncbi:MAG: ComEC/Rec2 family competence protein [Elusimicrobiota bacterium]|nr:ComEC/Rec2 family competence protein [Elusimicrobiota bacterium]